ncbi:MAG: type II toxin-antitoxin system RelE/ParE family toxin [Cyanothece sp. SIO2G6]|nr:type II toxin-antitoxin system RelE/ParE family toxin [Cyanothece sp. SIO2G6]
MRRICRITPRASQDIEAIADYLAQKNGLASAEDFLSDIDAMLNRIAKFPEIGRKQDELYPNLRSLLYKKHYLIFYRLLDESVEIFRIVSGYQDLTKLFEGGE